MPEKTPIYSKDLLKGILVMVCSDSNLNLIHRNPDSGNALETANLKGIDSYISIMTMDANMWQICDKPWVVKFGY